jgi:serine/threonine protein kinase
MSTSNQQTGKLPPQSFLHGRYLIVGQRGRGGMSVVYEAVDTQMAQRRVAVKEMSLSNTDEQDLPVALARFQQEATILEALSHPNLPRIHDAFSEDERSYFVMDYIEGKTLYQLLRDRQGQPLPVEHVLHYAHQLCDVLTYLHQQTPPIIFRDVKPTNIMVTPAGHIYLIDFGIARFFKEGQEHDTEYLGSRGYAAPEQHGLGQTTPRTDIYGLGSTLHQCLTGHDPFHAADPFIFTPVSYANPQAPALLSQLVQQMTAFDERARPARILEVKQALYTITEQAADATSTLPPSSFATNASARGTQHPAPYGKAVRTNYPISTRGISDTTPAMALHSGRAEVRLYQPGVPDPTTPRSIQQKPFWGPGFTLLFLLSLLITLGSSAIALLFFQPATSGQTSLLEFALAALFWLLTAISYWLVKQTLARTLLALNSIVGLLAALALLIIASPDLQDRIFNVLGLGVPYLAIAQKTLTVSLLVAAGSGLGWLLRPTSWLLRMLLALLFGGSLIFLLEQATSPTSNSSRHGLLLSVLVALVEGVVLAVRSEQVKQAPASLVLTSTNLPA